MVMFLSPTVSRESRQGVIRESGSPRSGTLGLDAPPETTQARETRRCTSERGETSRQALHSHPVHQLSPGRRPYGLLYEAGRSRRVTASRKMLRLHTDEDNHLRNFFHQRESDAAGAG